MFLTRFVSLPRYVTGTMFTYVTRLYHRGFLYIYKGLTYLCYHYYRPIYK